MEGIRGNFDTKGSYVRKQLRPFYLWLTSNGFDPKSAAGWSEDEYNKVFDREEGRTGYFVTTEWKIPKHMRVAQRKQCRYCSARSILWLISFSELNRPHVLACKTDEDSDTENPNEAGPVFRFVSEKTKKGAQEVDSVMKTINVNPQDIDLVHQFLNSVQEKRGDICSSSSTKPRNDQATPSS